MPKTEALTDIVQFRSDLFAPVLPEECQVNPQAYGAELAFWLSAALARKGIATSYPHSEDWSWFIEYSDDSGAEFAVYCYNIDGSANRWRLSLRRFGRKLLGRDKPPISLAARLISEIQKVLTEEPSVSDLRWLLPDV